MSAESEVSVTSEPSDLELVRAAQAVASGERDALHCIQCQWVIVFWPYGRALCPGHVYSEAGRREVAITYLCEWCFDEIAVEPDEDEEEGA
jgi:hypothetical protein